MFNNRTAALERTTADVTVGWGGRGLNAFYWRQIFILLAPNKVRNLFSLHVGLPTYAAQLMCHSQTVTHRVLKLLTGIGKIIFKVTHIIGGNNVLGVQFFRRSMKFCLDRLLCKKMTSLVA